MTHDGTTITRLIDASDPKYIKKVVGYEYRSNNSTQKTVCRLECGHERVLEYGSYPKTALCWECPKLETCGRCYGYGEVAEDLPDGNYVMVFCNCRAGRKAAELEAR